MTHSRAKCMKASFREYVKSKTYDIKDAYLKPSNAKVFFYNRLKYLFEIQGGTDFKIVSHNTHIFTLGFMLEINSEIAFVYVTPTKVRYIYLYEL